jgi:hypothetical protein
VSCLPGAGNSSPPPIHSIGPGGGRAADRTTWLPSRANCLVPVTALSPIYRALCKAERGQAGLLESIAPQGWTSLWHVHSRAQPHGHSACTSLAPAVCKVAIATRRIVGLTDRTVPCTSRNVGRTRPRTAPLDGLEGLRRFLPHVWPDGLQKVRHFGVLHASCAVPRAPIRLRLGQGPSSDDLAPQRQPPPRPAARGPICGAPMPVVMRLGTSPRALVDTG